MSRISLVLRQSLPPRPNTAKLEKEWLEELYGRETGLDRSFLRMSSGIKGYAGIFAEFLVAMQRISWSREKTADCWKKTVDRGNNVVTEKKKE